MKDIWHKRRAARARRKLRLLVDAGPDPEPWHRVRVSADRPLRGQDRGSAPAFDRAHRGRRRR